MKIVQAQTHDSRAVELQTVVRAERDGLPFLRVRDDAGRQRLIVLERDDERAWLGRGSGCEVRLDWDETVSRVHAELARAGTGWAIVDDGLSQNGTFVGGERVIGRRLLHDGDVVRAGGSTLTYHAPATSAARTARADDAVAMSDLTPAQRRVLAALCRPLVTGQGSAPASNRAIADELVITVATVKMHVRALFERFGVEAGLAQNQKRARLAELAVRAGLVSDRDAR